jgi:hypothetical protein
MPDEMAKVGWESDFPAFRAAPPARVREELVRALPDASPEQIRAWDASIPPLQHEVNEVMLRNELAHKYSAILEYELPMDSRRPDVILLVGPGVMVVELKGKAIATQADIDQASAYARDLRCYHAECADRSVVPVLVPTRARGFLGDSNGVVIAGPDALDQLIDKIAADRHGHVIDRDRFLSADAYRPLPTLVDAARELFSTGTLRPIHRARAETDPAVDEISRIIHQAALTKSRHLILVTGVPGSGKTLVGLRTVHAHYLDDLAVPRSTGRPTVPAVFLSGNAPLVDVLQHELREAGGGGRTFVRSVRDYVKRYSLRPGLVPPEHVLVFDEAQRAFDAAAVAATQGNAEGLSEPEHFVEFAARIPDWCVIVGLIGAGQEIHVGEEGGLTQWRSAVERTANSNDWTVHAPPHVAAVFTGGPVPLEQKPRLNLDVELRFHGARRLHEFVATLLAGQAPETLRPIAAELAVDGYHLRISRDIDAAKTYLHERYSGAPDARYGLIASSKDKALAGLGIPNDFQSTKQVRYGRWYGEPADSEVSCRRLEACVTEFGAQGLELDASLLAWGTDLIWTGDRWSNEFARRYKRGAAVRDPFQLRLNAYRVLLTRGRDATVVFVPQIAELDATFERLTASGFLEL